MNKSIQSFHVVIRVKNEIGVLTRIVMLLRKYRINIRSLQIYPIDRKEEFSDMFMELIAQRPHLDLVIAKLGRLIPVIEIKQGKSHFIEDR